MPVSTLRTCTIAQSDIVSHDVRNVAAHERKQYAALTHEPRRRDWLAGRNTAIQAVATHCAVSSTHLSLARGIDSAPIALILDDDDSWRALPLTISLSHHDGRAIAAVADSPARIGVDIARLGEIDCDHHRYFLSAAELPFAERLGAAAMWALKEASWKALSLSPDTPFTALELEIDGDELRAVQINRRRIPASAHTWQVTNNLIAALVLLEAGVE